MLLMISDLEEQLEEQSSARVYMETQCRRMMLHMDYMAAEIAELREFKQAAYASSTATEPATPHEAEPSSEANTPTAAETGETASPEAETEEARTNRLKQELQQLEEMCAEYEKACSPKSEAEAKPAPKEAESTEDQVNRAEAEVTEAKTKVESEDGAESDVVEGVYEEGTTQSKHAFMEEESWRRFLEDNRAMYAYLCGLEERAEAMESHIEVVQWQRDIYASECAHLRDYVQYLQRQLSSLFRANDEGAALVAAAEAYAANRAAAAPEDAPEAEAETTQPTAEAGTTQPE
eukprot:17465-Pyramimonas_sp.AAC.1